MNVKPENTVNMFNWGVSFIRHSERTCTLSPQSFLQRSGVGICPSIMGIITPPLVSGTPYPLTITLLLSLNTTSVNEHLTRWLRQYNVKRSFSENLQNFVWPIRLLPSEVLTPE